MGMLRFRGVGGPAFEIVQDNHQPLELLRHKTEKRVIDIYSLTYDPPR